MRRLVVLGSSGSGKTTVARRLADVLGYPLLELDSVFHRDGWADTADDNFVPIVEEFTDQPAWVVDGNYTSQGMRETLWPKADTFIWLDPTRSQVMRRVIARTLRRVITRERLWNGIREPWTNLYSLDPHQNIIVWAWTRYHGTKEKYEACLEDGSWNHATVHRLSTSSHIASLLDQARAVRPEPPGA